MAADHWDSQDTARASSACDVSVPCISPLFLLPLLAHAIDSDKALLFQQEQLVMRKVVTHIPHLAIILALLVEEAVHLLGAYGFAIVTNAGQFPREATKARAIDAPVYSDSDHCLVPLRLLVWRFAQHLL